MKIYTSSNFNCYWSSARAEDITTDMLNKRDDGAKMVYSQDIARIDVGDTATWLPNTKRLQCRTQQVRLMAKQSRTAKTRKRVCIYI